MIVQAKGQPAAIVPTTTQTPKAIIPAEIRSESTISMIGPAACHQDSNIVSLITVASGVDRVTAIAGIAHSSDVAMSGCQPSL